MCWAWSIGNIALEIEVGHNPDPHDWVSFFMTVSRLGDHKGLHCSASVYSAYMEMHLHSINHEVAR